MHCTAHALTPRCALPQSFYKDGPTGRPGMPRLALDIDATRMLIGAE
jgi:hypothetical protein